MQGALLDYSALQARVMPCELSFVPIPTSTAPNVRLQEWAYVGIVLGCAVMMCFIALLTLGACYLWRQRAGGGTAELKAVSTETQCHSNEKQSPPVQSPDARF